MGYAEAAPGALTAALPSLRQCQRKSLVVHAARVREVPIPGGGWFPYPESPALCGAETWGPAAGGTAGVDLSKVNCGACMRTVVWRERSAEKSKEAPR